MKAAPEIAIVAYLHESHNQIKTSKTCKTRDTKQNKTSQPMKTIIIIASMITLKNCRTKLKYLK